METLISITAVILIAINLPLSIALMRGVPTTTTSTCPEDIKSARHNRMMLKGIAIADMVIAIILFIVALWIGG